MEEEIWVRGRMESLLTARGRQTNCKADIRTQRWNAGEGKESLPFKKSKDKKNVHKNCSTPNRQKKWTKFTNFLFFWEQDRGLDEYETVVEYVSAICAPVHLQLQRFESPKRNWVVYEIYNNALERTFLENSKFTLKICVHRGKVEDWAAVQSKAIVADSANQPQTRKARKEIAVARP